MSFFAAIHFRSKLVRGSIGTALIKGSSVPLTLLIAVVLARALGPQGYGIYSYVFASISILAIPAQFGFPTLIVRETASAHVGSNWGRIKGIWRWCTWAAIVLSAGIILIGGLGAWYFIEEDNTKLMTFWWGLALIPAIALGNLRGAALRGLHKVVKGQLPERILRPGLFLLAIFGFNTFTSYESATPSLAMALHVAAGTLAFLCGAWILCLETPHKLWKSATPEYEPKRWTLSVAFLGIAGSLQVLTNNTDILMVGVFRPDEDVGLYRVAAQSALGVAFVQQTISLVLTPHFSRLYSQDKLKELESLFRRGTVVIFLFTLPLFLLVLAGSEPLIGLVFGDAYIAGANAFTILAAAKLLHAMFGPLGFLLSMSGNEKLVSLILGISFLINILLNLWWIPFLGIEGAALATAVTWLLLNLFLQRLAKRKINIQCNIFARPLH